MPFPAPNPYLRRIGHGRFTVTYEAPPDYIDAFFSELHPVRLFSEGDTFPVRGLVQRKCGRLLAARAFDYFYSRFEGEPLRARVTAWSP